MVSVVNQDAYANPAWGAGPNQPWRNANQAWGDNQPSGSSRNGPWGPPFWHPASFSRPVAIFFTILGFMFWWPVGLAMLFYTLGSGRMGGFGRRRRAMYRAENGQDAQPWDAWKAWARGNAGSRFGASSGNHAFDEYKAETLRRMEEEQKDFGAFLERLRFAKDKAEFDQFMAERRSRPPAPPAEEQPSA